MVTERMEELFKPIDRQIMMCDDQQDLLMLASIMATTAKRILDQQLGEGSFEKLFVNMYKGDEYDSKR